MISIDEMLATPSTLTAGRTYRQVLLDARALITDPDRWVQKDFARMETGDFCKPRDPRACQWCLLGATAWASNIHGIISPKLLEYFDQLRVYLYPPTQEPHFDSTFEMNDYLSHDKVLEFLDLAIQQLPN
jgi:hypothetical protein